MSQLTVHAEQYNAHAIVFITAIIIHVITVIIIITVITWYYNLCPTFTATNTQTTSNYT